MQEISYVKIFFVVLFGVFIANISSGTVIKYWIEYEATVAMQETSEALRLLNEENRRKIAIQQQKHREKLAMQETSEALRLSNEENRRKIAIQQQKHREKLARQSRKNIQRNNLTITK